MLDFFMLVATLTRTSKDLGHYEFLYRFWQFDIFLNTKYMIDKDVIIHRFINFVELNA